MIFVTTGNFDTGFDRLVRAVDDLFESGLLSGEGLAQIAGGNYKPRHMQYKRFLAPDEYDRAISEADLIFAHGGAGTVRAAASKKKPIIVLPRKASLKEHYNDHQSATAAIYADRGLALVAEEIEDFPRLITEAETFVPAEPGQAGKVVRLIRDYLDSLARERAGKC